MDNTVKLEYIIQIQSLMTNKWKDLAEDSIHSNWDHGDLVQATNHLDYYRVLWADSKRVKGLRLVERITTVTNRIVTNDYTPPRLQDEYEYTRN